MSGRVHTYAARTRWTGSTGVGYEDYGRRHEAATPPASAGLALSADAYFGGDAEHPNPEQLLVLAASSCQLLSFLAVAARARLDVREYADDAEGTMDEGDPPARLNRITLRPRITLGPGPSEERVRKLIALAHRECYVANSLRTEVTLEPRITFVPSGP